jgi:acetyl esterase
MSGRAADPELEAWLQAQPPFSEPDVAQLREAGAARARARPRAPAVAHVADLDAAGVPVRLYAPGPDAPALLVYLHGGGWTIGSIDTHDRLCRGLAVAAGVRVLSIGYRLAPEHPWPASIDDTVGVLEWVASAPAALGVAPAVVGVAGDSAGGTLAALACLRLRDETPSAMPDAQVLLCPNTDLTGTAASMQEKGRGWGLDAEQVRWFNRQWVSDPARWGEPGVSPLHAPDLTGLPPALVVTAEHDPLRDEGRRTPLAGPPRA